MIYTKYICFENKNVKNTSKYKREETDYEYKNRVQHLLKEFGMHIFAALTEQGIVSKAVIRAHAQPHPSCKFFQRQLEAVGYDFA